MECGGNGAENGFQSRPFLPPFHRYIDTCGFLESKGVHIPKAVSFDLRAELAWR